MNRLELLRKIAVIHAIKCANTGDQKVAEASFKTLDTLKGQVINDSDEELSTVSEEIEKWAETNPVANAHEIGLLMKRK